MHKLISPASNNNCNRSVWTELRTLMLRKIWLPQTVYAALPYIYIALGCYSIFAALFLTGWNWIVPYLLLLGLGFLHAGIAIFSLRWRSGKGLGSRPDNLRE